MSTKLINGLEIMVRYVRIYNKSPSQHPTRRRCRMNALNSDEELSKENLCSALVHSLRGIVWEADPLTFQFYFVSSQAEKLLGYPSQKWLNEPDFWRAHTHPDDIERCTAYCHDAVAKREDHDFQFRMFTADGRVVWIHDIVTVVQLDDGSMRLRGIMIDITNSKAAEEELRLKSFTIDNLAEEIIWTTPDGRIWNVNDVACEKLGYTREELISLTVADIDPLFPKEAWQPHWEEMKVKRSLQFESLHKTKNGRIYPVDIITNRFTHNGLEYNCAIVRDITEYKRMEKALRDSEERFRTLCDSAPIGIFMVDSEGNNIYNNTRWREITGLSATEGMGKEWLKGIHPDDRERLSEFWRETQATGRIYSLEHRQTTPQGKTIWVHALANPITTPDGKTVGYVGMVEDINELQQARQEMLKAQKLESLGLMAGGIAHDFNNILTSILGNLSLARLQSYDPGKVSQRLENAENATVRAKDLTQQLLTFAKGGEPIKKIIEVRGLLKEAAGFAMHGANVRCEFALADDLWPVEADEGQLSQVVHNLVLNAVQAMPDGGTVTISAGNVMRLKGGNRYVKISVADSGVGIAEQHLQKIFDPYFTTKQQGSGLGLATCYSIIKKHGGKITAKSILGEGSTFYISLPAATQENKPEPSAEVLVSQGSGRILVMDDEDEIREITKALLEELGYEVECANDGDATVEIYQQRKEQGMFFSAVIMDLTIPGGVGGKDALDKLLKIDPNVKAIVTSGYSNDPVMANYREYGFSAILTKPYRPQELNAVLQELLK